MPRTATHQITTDAREFGLHLQQGGWRLGLLVARNVVKAPGRVPAETLAPKTNATEFARQAGTTPSRVLRYLEAWERAATAGIVPPADTLTPGQEVLTHNGNAFVIDVDRIGSWQAYYKTPRPEPEPIVRTRPAPATPPPAPAPRPTPTIADPNVSAAVDDGDRRYRAERSQRQWRETTDNLDAHAQALHDEQSAEYAELLTQARWVARRMNDIARGPEWQAEGRPEAAEETRNLAHQLALVAEVVEAGTVTDAAITELINDTTS